MPLRRRAQLSCAGVAVVLALTGACGGSGGGAGTAPSEPGAGIDADSDNVITGPINQAKKVAGQAEQRDRQLEQRSGTTP